MHTWCRVVCIVRCLCVVGIFARVCARAGCGIGGVILLTLVVGVGVVRGRCVAHEVVGGWMVRGVCAVCGLVSEFVGYQGRIVVWWVWDCRMSLLFRVCAGLRRFVWLGADCVRVLGSALCVVLVFVVRCVCFDSGVGFMVFWLCVFCFVCGCARVCGLGGSVGFIFGGFVLLCFGMRGVFLCVFSLWFFVLVVYCCLLFCIFGFFVSECLCILVAVVFHLCCVLCLEFYGFK